MLSDWLRGSTESVATLKILLFYEGEEIGVGKREKLGRSFGSYCRHSDEEVIGELEEKDGYGNNQKLEERVKR